MPYGPALELQRAAARARIDGTLPDDLLLLVEHPPVVTLGRTSKPQHLSVSAEFLSARGIELFEVERGGDVTFHGPGQLVGYPIFDLRGLKPDLHWYLRQLEEALIVALARVGLPATRNPGHTGVWTAGGSMGPSEPLLSRLAPSGGAAGVLPGSLPTGSSELRKIASIGVHAREWVTWHGFALNVTTDLGYFELMTPCGIPGVRMTSLAVELGAAAPPMSIISQTAAEAVQERFGFDDRSELSSAELGARLGRPLLDSIPA
jgi:lipoyl(octanoyl) transferase